MEQQFDGVCAGYYLDDFTVDPHRFNKKIMEGRSIQSILEQEKAEYKTERNMTAFGYYLIYEYEVNGYHFVRASEKKCHRRDRGLAISEKMNKPFEVHFMQSSPFFSEIGKQIPQGIPVPPMKMRVGTSGVNRPSDAMPQKMAIIGAAACVGIGLLMLVLVIVGCALAAVLNMM